MKLFVITIDDVYDFEGFPVKPIVCITRKEARKELARLKRSAKETYKDRFDGEDPAHPDRFSLYIDGRWSEGHYDARIEEVDIEIPVFALATTSYNNGQILSCDTRVYTEQRKAVSSLKESARKETKKAKECGKAEIETIISSEYAEVEFLAGDDFQRYQFWIKDEII